MLRKNILAVGRNRNFVNQFTSWKKKKQTQAKRIINYPNCNKITNKKFENRFGFLFGTRGKEAHPILSHLRERPVYEKLAHKILRRREKIRDVTSNARVSNTSRVIILEYSSTFPRYSLQKFPINILENLVPRFIERDTDKLLNPPLCNV